MSSSTNNGTDTPTNPASTSTSSPESSSTDSSSTPDSSSPSSTPSPSTTPTVSSSSSLTTPSPSSSPSSSTPSSTPSTSSSSTPSSSPTSSSTLTSSGTTATTIATTITKTPSSGTPSVVTIVTTSFNTPTPSVTSSSTSSSASSTGTTGLQSSGNSTSSHGLGTGGTIAVAVVVPIVAVALLVLAGIFLWRKRKARKDAEELRRKEVEEYGYNPNNDPTLPATAGTDGPFEMREDGSSGYRGWGTTAVASSGRKASTTLSGPSAGGIGTAYSEGTSPTHGPVSDTRSENALVDGYPSGEQEALGAMGPAASANRSGDINRGPSNASSSYSAANRSDGSGEGGAGGAYYNQYDTGNPYTDTAYGSPPGRAEMSAQPVIRDVQARRNTRIENPSHFPQQSAGISQNF